MTSSIYCFGEILWDCLPHGMFLGGAPFNVACHLAKLGAPAAIITSVGRDFRGKEALRRAREAGVDVSAVTMHSELPTGTVSVTLDEQSNASYEFPSPVAWDEISVSDEVRAGLKGAHALVFGTLALRLQPNRDLLCELLESTSALKCLDVNLRSPYDDIERALKVASKADLVKLNEEELGRMTDLPIAVDEAGLAMQCERLKVFTGVGQVCVTRGAEGAFFWRNGEMFSADAPKVDVVDTIGAGDAFMAALIYGLVGGQPITEALRAACERGAMVAGQDGAV